MPDIPMTRDFMGVLGTKMVERRRVDGIVARRLVG